MDMPTPFQIGAAVGSNISGGIRESRETSALDTILTQFADNPQEQNMAMQQILRNISEERRPMAMQMLQQKQQQIANQQRLSNRRDYLKSQGLPESLATESDAVYKDVLARASKSNAPPQSKEVSKYIIKELDKEPAVDALLSSVSELERLNQENVTGPVVGRLPAFVTDKRSNAIRAEIDANGIQLLNVFKSMFPRGITQGEFKELATRIVSSTNTPEANRQIAKVYRRLGNMQKAKINAIKEVSKEYGNDPNLPIILSDYMQKLDDQAVKEVRDIYKAVTGKEPSKEGENRPSLGDIFNG